MSEYRWERRERKLKAQRERIKEHGAAYKKIIVPRIAARALAAAQRARPEPAAGETADRRGKGTGRRP